MFKEIVMSSKKFKNTKKKDYEKNKKKPFDKKRFVVQVLIVGLAFITAVSFLFVSFIYM